MAVLGIAALYYIISMIQYPFSALVLPHLKTRESAAVGHIICGLIICVVTFRMDTLLCILAATLGYFMTYLPPGICFFVALGVGLIYHAISALRTDEWVMDFTNYTMILVQKIISLTFNLADGKQLKEKGKLVRKRWEIVALEERPNFFMWLAYAFTPFGSTSNPFFEYKTFLVMLDRGKREAPKKETQLNAFKEFVLSIACAITTAIVLDKLNFSVYYSEFFLSHNPFIRLQLVLCNTIINSIRYFPAWHVVQSGILATGVSELSEVPPDEYSNLNLWEILRCESVKDWFRLWNHSTHIFFKNYCYCRLLNLGYSSTIGNGAVFLTSAFWHGVKPTYYLVLPESQLYVWTDNAVEKIFPKTPDEPLLRKIIHRYWVITATFYLMSSWFEPTYEAFIYMRKITCLIPVFIAIAICIISFAIPKRKKEHAK